MDLSIHTVGINAKQIISYDQNAIITGVTSRGIFISTQKGHVLFLSGEKWRGPLTLNLKNTEEIYERINLGDSLRIQDQSLIFPKSSISISTTNGKEWAPPSPSTNHFSPVECQRRIEAVCQRLSTKSEFFSSTTLDRMRLSEYSNNEKKIANELKSFLGRGTGLTPSGDDLIVGFLLALNRWGATLYPSLSMERINQSIILASRRSTTSLSASLIECATKAVADERLILALDSLVTGKPCLDVCTACLKKYGSSSGKDALLGMKLVLCQG